MNEPTSEGHAVIGQRLAEVRRRHNVSQRELGRRLHRSHTVVGRWENGGLEPTLLDIAAVSRVLGVDVSTIFDGVSLLGRGRQRSSRAHGFRDRRAVGVAIRERRTAARLTPIEAAVRCGIPPMRLLAMEDGSDPSLGELGRLAGGLRIDLKGLVRSARDARHRGDV